MPEMGNTDGDHAAGSLSLLDELCRVAHLCWREKMTSEGWRVGDTFDADGLLHDALVPFVQLSRRDRRSLRIGVLAEEVEQHLADIVEYERGPVRVFLVEEMSVGLRVGLTPVDDPSDNHHLPGRIVDWEVDPDTGELEAIRVRWDDGDVTTHHPDVKELRRLG